MFIIPSANFHIVQYMRYLWSCETNAQTVHSPHTLRGLSEAYVNVRKTPQYLCVHDNIGPLQTNMYAMHFACNF